MWGEVPSPSAVTVQNFLALPRELQGGQECKSTEPYPVPPHHHQCCTIVSKSSYSWDILSNKKEQPTDTRNTLDGS